MEELYEALRDHGLDMPEVGTNGEKTGKNLSNGHERNKKTTPFSI